MGIVKIPEKVHIGQYIRIGWDTGRVLFHFRGWVLWIKSKNVLINIKLKGDKLKGDKENG